eukprot:1227303-Rhodomonas_salina.2
MQVLKWGMKRPGAARIRLGGAEGAHVRAIILRLRYAMSGTDCRDAATRFYMHSVPEVSSRMCLGTRYATRGSDARVVDPGHGQSDVGGLQPHYRAGSLA